MAEGIGARIRISASGPALRAGYADQLGGLVNLGPASGQLTGQPLWLGSDWARSKQCFHRGIGEGQEPRTTRAFPAPAPHACTPAVVASAPPQSWGVRTTRILAAAGGVAVLTQQPAIRTRSARIISTMSCPAPLTRAGASGWPPRAASRRYGTVGTMRVRPGDLRPGRVIPVFMTGLRVSCSTHKGSDASSLIACRGRPRQVSRPQSGTQLEPATTAELRSEVQGWLHRFREPWPARLPCRCGNSTRVHEPKPMPFGGLAALTPAARHEHSVEARIGLEAREMGSGLPERTRRRW